MTGKRMLGSSLADRAEAGMSRSDSCMRSSERVFSASSDSPREAGCAGASLATAAAPSTVGSGRMPWLADGSSSLAALPSGAAIVKIRFPRENFNYSGVTPSLQEQ